MKEEEKKLSMYRLKRFLVADISTSQEHRIFKADLQKQDQERDKKKITDTGKKELEWIRLALRSHPFHDNSSAKWP